MTADAVRRVRDAFLAADFTTTGVETLLGDRASRALSRDETVPARRATRAGSRLDTLVRLFLLERPVPVPALAAALPLDDVRRLGLVDVRAGAAHAALDVRPYGEDDGPPWWLVSDLGTGLDGHDRPLAADHVLGPGGASTMLAQLTPRDQVDTVVDIGTGCGVQALHATRHSRTVVATDVSVRATRLAALTAGLSDVELDLRVGDLLAPVAGEQADLLVSNPPFVVSPTRRALSAGHHTYRDSGLPLDEVCARLVGGAHDALAPEGTLVMLGSWVHRDGTDWRARVAGWLPPGVDAVVVQREVLDPAEYVALWLRDSGETGAGSGTEAYVAAYDGWLGALEAEGVTALGLGFVVLRRTDEPTRSRLLDWPHPVAQPLGPELRSWLDRRAWLAPLDDDGLLGARLRLADDVVQEQVGRPGAEHPEHVLLRRRTGLRSAVRVDTGTAALVGACDGTLPVGRLVDAVATVLGTDAGPLREQLLGEVRDLVDAGYLQPRPP